MISALARYLRTEFTAEDSSAPSEAALRSERRDENAGSG